jgi:hypothetical protein
MVPSGPKFLYILACILNNVILGYNVSVVAGGLPGSTQLATVLGPILVELVACVPVQNYKDLTPRLIS